MPDQENTSSEGENKTSRGSRGAGRDKRHEWKLIEWKNYVEVKAAFSAL